LHQKQPLRGKNDRPGGTIGSGKVGAQKIYPVQGPKKRPKKKRFQFDNQA